MFLAKPKQVDVLLHSSSLEIMWGFGFGYVNPQNEDPMTTASYDSERVLIIVLGFQNYSYTV